jgi:hypothetical protein
MIIKTARALLCIVAIFCMPLTGTLNRALAEEKPRTDIARADTLQLGERMYREGLLPSGEPMQAFVKGDLPVSGTVFTCISCHQRSGLGSVEGGVSTPATNWAQLIKPFQMRYTRFGMKNSAYFQIPVNRPAYTDETLAKVLRSGLDPAGRTLDDVMPRYLLGDEDMAIMISYLKSLSSQFSPGISDTNFMFATVITDDVSVEDRDAMLAPLMSYINIRNNQAAFLRKLADSGKLRMAGNLLPPPRQAASLSLWLLKGPPDTWRGQLEDYYRKEPVFALIGGITRGEWKPIHQFSEDNHIPCLFPNTDFPVISRTDWYTLYLSKGYYQEGESAARYLNDREKILKGGPIIQIVRDSREGRALSAGFQEAWKDMGIGALVTLILKPGEELTKGAVQKILAKEKSAVVVLWDGPAALPELETLTRDKNKPAMIFVSSSYLGRSMWTLKEQVRDVTYITYPFRLQDKADPWNPQLVLSAGATKEANQAYSIKEVLTLALVDMNGNYYRDNFLDVIAMIDDLEVPLYERLSFGPGQRYASKGCYIVQLSQGEKPVLIKKSNWVIH